MIRVMPKMRRVFVVLVMIILKFRANMFRIRVMLIQSMATVQLGGRLSYCQTEP